MKTPGAILVIHTAFIGDVILVLPLLQALRELFPTSRLAVVSVPASAGVLGNHPAVDHVYLYDKRGADRGVGGFRRVCREVRAAGYDLALVPHRSFRSAALAWRAGIPRRVGFDTSAGRMFHTDVAEYRKEHHEIVRNLDLLLPLGVVAPPVQLPRVHPSKADTETVEEVLREHWNEEYPGQGLAALAPGSVWFTKRWPRENFTSLAAMLLAAGWKIVLVGGREDRELCEGIADQLRSRRIISLAGRLSLLQSAALLSKCRVVVSNDSAPMHLATAIGTPVIGIFGATAPSFGFSPSGPNDRTVGVDSLSCRPCAIHGGTRCPIGTLECMWGIQPAQVYHMIQEIIDGTSGNG